MDHAVSIVDTPIGRYAVAASAAGITRIEPVGDAPMTAASRMGDAQAVAAQGDDAACTHLRAAERALAAYFDGARRDFDDLVLAGPGTPFQSLVWEALRRIPFGATESYGGLARRIRQPRAARAVGLANGRNPIAIVVPCHRVIGSRGALTGYAGGLERKRWLLDHERKAQSSSSTSRS